MFLKLIIYLYDAFNLYVFLRNVSLNDCDHKVTLFKVCIEILVLRIFIAT